jgi:hypothetical protein
MSQEVSERRLDPHWNEQMKRGLAKLFYTRNLDFRFHQIVVGLNWSIIFICNPMLTVQRDLPAVTAGQLQLSRNRKSTHGRCAIIFYYACSIGSMGYLPNVPGMLSE